VNCEAQTTKSIELHSAEKPFVNLSRQVHRKEEEGAWSPATRNRDSLLYGYGALNANPQGQQTPEKLGFFREKKIYQQGPAGQRSDRNKNIAHAFIFDLNVCLFFAQILNAL